MRNLIAFILIITSSAAQAQAETKPFKRFTFNDINLAVGGFTGYADIDKSGIQQYSGVTIEDTSARYGNYFYDLGHLNAQAFIKINNKESKLNHAIGVGFSFNISEAWGYNINVPLTQSRDTFFAANGPAFIIVDSTTSDLYSGYLTTINLLGNFSYRVSTNPARKFSAYAAFNIGIGGAVLSTYENYKSDVYNVEASQVIDTTNIMPPIFSHTFNSTLNIGGDYNARAVSSTFILKPYIAVGFSYRLSKNIPGLRNLSVIGEARLGSQYIFINNKTHSGFTRGFAGGLRYTIPVLENPAKSKG